MRLSCQRCSFAGRDIIADRRERIKALGRSQFPFEPDHRPEGKLRKAAGMSSMLPSSFTPFSFFSVRVSFSGGASLY